MNVPFSENFPCLFIINKMEEAKTKIGKIFTPGGDPGLGYQFFDEWDKLFATEGDDFRRFSFTRFENRVGCMLSQTRKEVAKPYEGVPPLCVSPRPPPKHWYSPWPSPWPPTTLSISLHQDGDELFMTERTKGQLLTFIRLIRRSITRLYICKYCKSCEDKDVKPDDAVTRYYENLEQDKDPEITLSQLRACMMENNKLVYLLDAKLYPRGLFGFGLEMEFRLVNSWDDMIAVNATNPCSVCDTEGVVGYRNCIHSY